MNGARGVPITTCWNGTDMNDGTQRSPINQGGVFCRAVAILPIDALGNAVLSNFQPEYGRNAGAVSIL